MVKNYILRIDIIKRLANEYSTFTTHRRFQRTMEGLHLPCQTLILYSVQRLEYRHLVSRAQIYLRDRPQDHLKPEWVAALNSTQEHIQGQRLQRTDRKNNQRNDPGRLQPLLMTLLRLMCHIHLHKIGKAPTTKRPPRNPLTATVRCRIRQITLLVLQITMTRNILTTKAEDHLNTKEWHNLPDTMEGHNHQGTKEERNLPNTKEGHNPPDTMEDHNRQGTTKEHNHLGIKEGHNLLGTKEGHNHPGIKENHIEMRSTERAEDHPGTKAPDITVTETTIQTKRTPTGVHMSLLRIRLRPNRHIPASKNRPNAPMPTWDRTLIRPILSHHNQQTSAKK